MLGEAGLTPSLRVVSLTARGLALALVTAAVATLSGGPARSAEEPVEPGSALATAQVLTAKVTYGGYGLPLTVAASGASYKDSAAQATSHGISTGSVTGLAAGGGSCGGGSAAPAKLAQPPLAPIEASTTDEATAHESTGSIPFGAGEVSASRSPLGAASTTSAIAVAVPALLTVSGSSTASVSYTEGKGRNASASAAVDVVLANGLVKLSGLTWEISRRGAADPEVEGSFALVAVTVAGVQFKIGTAEQLKAAIDAANAALKVLGIAIDVPELGRTEDAASIPPLNVRIFGSSTLAALIRPLIKLKVPVQDSLTNLLAGDECGLGQLATLVGTTALIADIVLAALSGEGTIELGIGGAQVSTAAPPRFQDPFAGAPPSKPGKPTQGAGTVTAATGGAAVAPVPAAPPLAAAPLPGTDVLTQTAPALVQMGCVSVNPADHRPCSQGAGLRVTGLLLLAGLALFGADLYQSRRRQPLVRRSLR